jgi:membrane protease YdiL (CAAX protease family)
MNYLLDSGNHLFELARSGQRLPHLILAIVLGFVFVIVSQLVGGIPAALIVMALSMAEASQPALDNVEGMMAMLTPDTALEQVIFLILAFGPIFLILWVWLALYEKRRLRTIGLEIQGAVQKYLRGLVIGLLMFSAAVGISALFGFVAFERGDPQQQGLVVLGSVLFVFAGWMVQGAAEEALTRGWLLPVIGARYHPLLGIIISSIIFAVYHSLNPNLNPIAMLNLVLFGLFAALFALYEGGLWGIFSIHSVWNWAQGNLYGFEVSGVFPAGGALFNLMETGPDVVTGGAFGPEGGLAVTLVLLVSCALVWMAGRRKVSGSLP